MAQNWNKIQAQNKDEGKTSIGWIGTRKLGFLETKYKIIRNTGNHKKIEVRMGKT